MQETVRDAYSNNLVDKTQLNQGANKLSPSSLKTTSRNDYESEYESKPNISSNTTIMKQNEEHVSIEVEEQKQPITHQEQPTILLTHDHYRNYFKPGAPNHFKKESQ